MLTVIGDLTFAVELIAVGIGAALMIFGQRNTGKGVLLARCAGLFVGFLALAALIVTVYFSFQTWVVEDKLVPPAIHNMR
jgi:hypothetical protein